MGSGVCRQMPGGLPGALATEIQRRAANSLCKQRLHRPVREAGAAEWLPLCVSVQGLIQLAAVGRNQGMVATQQVEHL